MPCVSLFDQKITDRDAKHCVSLFDQKLIDRDAKHCVSTFGLAIQIRILKPVNGYNLD
ncbi:MAG: hypothetical protein LBB88_04780 [Planctomycetaceae bacterium]|nr:hypothetical protein [Planctomycetaceae bacterium]